MKTLIGLALIALLFASGCVTDEGRMAGMDRQPIVTYMPKPVYPFEARKAGISGEVVLQFVVTTKGDVTDVVVVRASHPLLAAAAVEAIRQSKYQPGMKDGVPVNTRLQVPIGFSLSDD